MDHEIDMAPFGEYGFWTDWGDPHEIRMHCVEPSGGALAPGGKDGDLHLGVQWDEPRQVRAVAVTYEGEPPDPSDVRVQWWQRNWPYKERWARRGAHRGWIGRDDPFNGRWVTALADLQVDGATHIYAFRHLDVTELGDLSAVERAEEYLPRHRLTLRIRLLFGEAAVKVQRIRALAPGAWAEGDFLVHFGLDGLEADWSGELSAWNGYVTSGGSWTCRTSGRRESRAFSLRYTDGDPESPQRTVLTFHTRARTFSVLVADVLSDGCVFLPDLGVAVSKPDVDVERFIRDLRASGRRCIYDRVWDESEQTRRRAFAETPRLGKVFQEPPFGRYLPLCPEGNRFEFALRYNGNVFVSKRRMKPAGRDVVDLLWPGAETEFAFPTGDPPDPREREDGAEQSLLDGYLPIVTTRWMDRDVEYTQEAFCAYLDREMGRPLGARGDEPTVCCLRFTLRNTTTDPVSARLWFVIRPHERMELRDGLLWASGRLRRYEPKPDPLVRADAARFGGEEHFRWEVIPYDEPRVRVRIDAGPPGSLRALPFPSGPKGSYAVATAAVYDVQLPGGASQTVTVFIPFQTPGGERLARLRRLDYDAKRADVEKFWRAFSEKGARFDLPDRLMTDLLRAVPIHVLMSADKDPASRLYVLPAATFGYGACGNEACIQVRQLDYQGHHEMADAYLEGLLAPQGRAPLDGNFRSSDGVLQGVDIYDGRWSDAAFGYNLDHGFILTAACEHYLVTRDAAWLLRVAERLVAACDYITRERQATKVMHAGRKDPAWGLLPAGHLEDNEEWRHWFAVNAHAYRGMELAGRVLAEIAHPDAARIAADAAAYREDILEAVRRATELSPAVRLQDGTYVPHVPARTHIRGREWGWFREGAYGPLHLVDGGLLDPASQEVEWIHKYLEDCVYPSRDFGRPIDVRDGWFSGAGVTIQANLLNNAPAYLRADRVKHAVRALMNNLAASVYEDVRCFAEHPITELGIGTGPFYKTPDECGFLNWLRMCLLMEEDGVLWICRGAPREWFQAGKVIAVQDAPTYFGRVSFRIESADALIVASVRLPDEADGPQKVLLRLRHGGRLRMKTVLLDGGPHEAFDPALEVVDLSGRKGEVEVQAAY